MAEMNNIITLTPEEAKAMQRVLTLNYSAYTDDPMADTLDPVAKQAIEWLSTNVRAHKTKVELNYQSLPEFLRNLSDSDLKNRRLPEETSVCEGILLAWHKAKERDRQIKFDVPLRSNDLMDKYLFDVMNWKVLVHYDDVDKRRYYPTLRECAEVVECVEQYCSRDQDNLRLQARGQKAIDALGKVALVRTEIRAAELG